MLLWWLEGYKIEDLQYLTSFKIMGNMLSYSDEVSPLLSKRGAHLQQIHMASCSIEDSLDSAHPIRQLCLHIVLILDFPQGGSLDDERLALPVGGGKEGGYGVGSGPAHWRLFIIWLRMTPHL